MKRFLRRVRGRLSRDRERLRLKLTAGKAGRAARALPPRAPVQGMSESDELLTRLGRDLTLGHLTRVGLQTDSVVVYEALARRASRGALDCALLVEEGRRHSDPAQPAPALRSFDAGALISLARVMQQHRHPHTGHVLTLALAARSSATRGALLVLGQLLMLENRGEDARTVLGGLQRAGWEGERLASDLLNPFAGGYGTEADWIASVRGIYAGTGVEALTLTAATTDEPFDRLAADVAPGSVTGGPLVSVIMSTFRPDAAAVASARSILAQSWRELELLVMDDASGPDYDAVLDELAALDDRVRVVRAEVNAGTYVRRNDALRVATGSLVTMQDSDDWSHPRRLELQVRHLEANPAIPANLITSIRLSSELLFSQRRGLQPRLCEPALMFRRELVVGRIGYFDTVRKSADSEFRVRISQTFGADVPVIHVASPLMLMRFDRASLSGGDFGDGWTHPSRFAYRSAYLRWQIREIRAGRDPYLGFPLAERPFPAPARISGQPVVPRRFRVVVAGDGRWETPDEATPELLAALEEARSAGVGPADLALLQLPSLRSAESQLLAAPLQDLVNDGTVAEVSLGDDATTDLLVVAHADAALGLPRGEGSIRARRVILVAGRLGADGRGYAADLIDSVCREAFGTDPEWREAGSSLDLGAVSEPDAE